MSFDGLSFHPLVKELNALLAGGRIDKIMQPNQHAIMLFIRQPGKNYTLHISLHPVNPILHITTAVIENPASPPVFCMALRKQIEDGRIANLRQHLLDRLIFIDIDVRGAGGEIETKTLAIELMGKYSNLILIKNGLIIDALKKIGTSLSRVRQVLPMQPYFTPPSQDKYNLADEKGPFPIEALTKHADLPLQKALLAAFLGFGPVTAKEILFRAGLDSKTPFSTLTLDQTSMLCAEILNLTKPLFTGRLQPTVVLDQNQKVLAVAPFFPNHLAPQTAYTFTTLSEAIDFAAQKADRYAPPEKDVLFKFALGEINKLKNKLLVLQQDLAEANDAETMKSYADLLMAYQYQLKPDKTALSVQVADFYQPDTIVEIPIQPLLSLTQNAEKYYQKYNKLKRAQNLVAKQIEQTELEISYLSGLKTTLSYLSSALEISEVKSELVQSGYLKQSHRKAAVQKRSQPLKLQSVDGFTVFVGKNNLQNDALTFKIAGPDDIWLHIKDHPGSHVIVQTENREISPEVLTFAAQAAVYYSQARDSSKVAVDYTKRRYVKKPAKAKPGFVTYTRQKTVYITPDETILEKIKRAEH